MNKNFSHIRAITTTTTVSIFISLFFYILYSYTKVSLVIILSFIILNILGGVYKEAGRV